MPSACDSVAYVTVSSLLTPYDYSQDGRQGLVLLQSFSPPSDPARVPGTVFVSTGTRLDRNALLKTVGTAGAPGAAISPLLVLDIDGDGLPDVLGTDASGNHYYA